MKLVKSIENVMTIIDHDNKLYSFGGPKANKDEVNLVTKGSKAIVMLEKYSLISHSEFSEILGFDNRFDLIKKIDPGMNLYNASHFKNCIILPHRTTQIRWSISQNLELLNLEYTLNSYYVINDLFFYDNSKIIKCYAFKTTLLWEVDVTQYGVYKEKVKDGFKELENSRDREVFGDQTTIFVSLRGGQLLALDLHNGSLKWILEMEYSGFYSLFKDRIYKISNGELYEIDVVKGEILRSVKASDIIKHERYWFVQNFKAYDDYILLKNQSGWVAMVNRKTFCADALVEIPQGLVSSTNNMHWLNGYLYILDMSNTLHIYN